MSNNNTATKPSGINLVVTCPHCSDPIIIEELNCCIFRHGIFKETALQIDPHSSEELCNYYISQKKIYGCGKPFQIINVNGEYCAIKCGYI
jgi:hypothetical protein